ncbi:MAG: hypothetical protein ACXVLQ_06250 [Bacteriovorax sp.]
MNLNSISIINKTLVKIIVSFSLLAATLSANAQRHFDGGRGHWRGGDIRRFEMHDRDHWRGGYWHHGNHGGHLGWWWVVGPSWYYYYRPIYPYPNPYVPSTVIVPTPQATPTVQYWYYCEAQKEYYPYVSTCSSGWKPVPANPLLK